MAIYLTDQNYKYTIFAEFHSVIFSVDLPYREKTELCCTQIMGKLHHLFALLYYANYKFDIQVN